MKLAIFDLDGTLICGDSSSLFLDSLCDKKLITPEFRHTDDNLIEQFFKGTLDIRSYYTYSLTPIVGKTTSELAEILHDYIESYIRPVVYPKALELIRKYQNEGTIVIIASATTDLIVETIAKHIFKVDNVIATRMVYDQNGKITGEVYPNISHQEGKAKRILELCQQRGWNLADSDSYGDSINDVAMLEITTRPHAVNANEGLLKIARVRNWAIENFERPLKA